MSATQRRPTEQTIDILRQLVAFPTVSRDPNDALIEWVREYLAGHGIESRITRGAEPGKSNLFATIGDGDGGIVLSGHTDVVPVDDQNWSTDPFTLTERDGLLYGRGTCDMKGFVAVALAKVPRLLAGKRTAPVHLAFSFDEEIGCKGAPHLIADMVKAGIRPRGCIVGEPSSMRAVVGHKSGSVFNVSVEGREVHSSLAPQGVNALEYAARLICHIREVAERLQREEERHEGYEVPFSTLQTCVIEAGHAANVVPARCVFRFDMRTLPWTDQAALLDEIRNFADEVLVPEMRAIAPEAAIRIDRKGSVPGFSIDEDDPLVRYVQRLVGSNAEPGHVTFGSEAGLFSQADVPSIICGPGSISQAHKPDEYVAPEQLALCEDFIDRLADTDID